MPYTRLKSSILKFGRQKCSILIEGTNLNRPQQFTLRFIIEETTNAWWRHLEQVTEKPQIPNLYMYCMYLKAKVLYLLLLRSY